MWPDGNTVRRVGMLVCILQRVPLSKGAFMKKAAIGIIAVAALIGPRALAADMPVKAPPMAPPAPTYNWSGCYVGGYVGSAWTRNVGLTDINEPGDVTSYKLGNTITGGGALGCNWQPVASPFVLGVEGEGGYLRMTGRGPEKFNTALFSDATIGPWYAMVTGRIGYAWNRALIYIKGGGAFTELKNDIIPPMGPIGTSSRNVDTWTAGGGLEWAFDNHWSAKAEYMFIGLHNTNLTCISAASAPPSPTLPCWSHSFGGIHTVEIGINYRWNGVQ
jgi:outer membrane immunogenic protein